MSVTAPARSCSPASQSCPATKPPVHGRPVSASCSSASGEIVSQRPSSPVTCGSSPPCGPIRRASASACSSTRDLEGQPFEAGDAHLLAAPGTLGTVRVPELSLHADPAVGPALVGDLDHPADQRLGAHLHCPPLGAPHPPDR